MIGRVQYLAGYGALGWQISKRNWPARHHGKPPIIIIIIIIIVAPRLPARQESFPEYHSSTMIGGLRVFPAA